MKNANIVIFSSWVQTNSAVLLGVHTAAVPVPHSAAMGTWHSPLTPPHILSMRFCSSGYFHCSLHGLLHLNFHLLILKIFK